MSKSIVIIGCFDTKGEDFTYLYNCIKVYEKNVLTINTGVMESTAEFPIDFNNEEVAMASGTLLKSIRESGDRGKAVEFMGKGVAKILSQLVSKDQVKGVVGMGGGGGTYIVLEGMQSVPFGIPKLCLSTIAGKDLSRQIGVKDITMMTSVVDVAGINSISSLLIKQLAAAICSMSEVEKDQVDNVRKKIAISMFGNTTKCVNKCTELLKQKDYEVFVFHATGTGGATMEALIRQRFFDGVLDVTTTELADELCEGILSAGKDRVTAAGDMGIPQIIVPGCLDMVNYAQIHTIPEKYKSRQLYSWSPDITLMRTNAQENKILGNELAIKAKNANGPVEIMLPLKGVSILDSLGERFYLPEVDAVLFDSIKESVEGRVLVTEIDTDINHEVFAINLVERLLKLMEK